MSDAFVGLLHIIIKSILQQSTITLHTLNLHATYKTNQLTVFAHL
jgi:hypothetical protein